MAHLLIRNAVDTLSYQSSNKESSLAESWNPEIFDYSEGTIKLLKFILSFRYVQFYLYLLSGGWELIISR